MKIDKDLNLKEVQKLLHKEKNLAHKLIISHLYELDMTDLVLEAKNDLDQYIEDLLEVEDSTYLETILFDYDPLMIELFKRQNLPSFVKSFLRDKLSTKMNSTSFSLLDDNKKDIAVDSLIVKNQLKGDLEFIKEKIERNVLFVKMDNNELIHSLGLKEVDPKLLDLIDAKYHSYKELGYAQNNGDKSEFREELQKVLDLLNEDGLIAFIRNDNGRALKLTKEFGFRTVGEIKSPYSSNILVVLVKD